MRNADTVTITTPARSPPIIATNRDFLLPSALCSWRLVTERYIYAVKMKISKENNVCGFVSAIKVPPFGKLYSLNQMHSTVSNINSKQLGRPVNSKFEIFIST